MLCVMADHAEQTSSEAADHVAIRELFDGYARCAVRRDAEGRSPGTATVTGCFAERDLVVDWSETRPMHLVMPESMRLDLSVSSEVQP
jgi:hypothetical protein